MDRESAVRQRRLRVVALENEQVRAFRGAEGPKQRSAAARPGAKHLELELGVRKYKRAQEGANEEGGREKIQEYKYKECEVFKKN